MNIIENLDQLDEIYGKSDGYVISLYNISKSKLILLDCILSLYFLYL